MSKYILQTAQTVPSVKPKFMEVKEADPFNDFELEKKEITDENSFFCYKGFTDKLSCRNTVFEVSKTYYSGFDDNLELCSEKVIHCCRKLLDCFRFYPQNSSENNKFCIVEVKGKFIEESEKLGTNLLKIIRELTPEEIKEIITKENEERIDEKIGLEIVKKLQRKFPNLILAGSVSLYLRGILREEIYKRNSDIDFVSPYWVDLTEDLENSEKLSSKSGNDFNYSIIVDNIKVELAVSNTQTYEIITYKDVKYKVSTLYEVLEYKLKYAIQGSEKHQRDISKMIFKK